jgi:hypothetical protein
MRAASFGLSSLTGPGAQYVDGLESRRHDGEFARERGAHNIDARIWLSNIGRMS